MFVSDSAESPRSRLDKPGIDDLRQMAWCGRTERKDLVGGPSDRKTEKERGGRGDGGEERKVGRRGDYLKDVGMFSFEAIVD